MNAEHKKALIDEIVIQALRDDVRKWQQRAEAAEVEGEKNLLGAHAWEEHARRATAERDVLQARLAELAKQKPAGKFVFEPMGERWHHIKYGEAQHAEPKLPLVKLFTRPAPAADLAELVPDDKAIRKEAGGYAPIYSLHEQQLFIDGATWLRDAILRNIELLKRINTTLRNIEECAK